MTGCLDDDRAVSEGIGVAALVLLTVLVTASVGMSVLFVEDGDSDGIEAEFEFRYFSDQSVLFITYNEGPELTAGNVTVIAPDRNMTWSELGNQNATDQISPGSGIQLSQSGAYGSGIGGSDTVSIAYRQDGNLTIFDTYNGDES